MSDVATAVLFSDDVRQALLDAGSRTIQSTPLTNSNGECAPNWACFWAPTIAIAAYDSARHSDPAGLDSTIGLATTTRPSLRRNLRDRMGTARDCFEIGVFRPDTPG